MTIHYQGHGVTLHHGDCLDVLRTLPDASVDSVVTDPPYGLEFMGKDWDAPWKASSVGRGVRVESERAAEMTERGKGHSTPGGPFLAARVDSTRVAGKPFQDWCELWAAECLRVLKPGGHLLAFGGTRTWHRLACAVEDAGFEVRDSIAWMYGSGFPKSLDVSKAIDKGAGENRARQLEFTAWMRSTGITASQINAATSSFMGSHYLTNRKQAAIATADMFDRLRPLLPAVPEPIERLVAERTGIEWTDYVNRPVLRQVKRTGKESGTYGAFAGDNIETAAATDESSAWQGWGTALKPAFEPVVVARKPLSGTVAATVLEHGTGALNIDGCRIGDGDDRTSGGPTGSNAGEGYGGGWSDANAGRARPSGGRWPANVVLDESQAGALDEQSGEAGGGTGRSTRGGGNGGDWNPTDRTEGAGQTVRGDGREVGYGDMGGASRFFFVASHDKGDTSALTGKGGRIESCETASTAAESSSPPRQFGDSALGGAVTSEHPDTASQTGSPSTSATPSGSRPSGRPATPTTQNIDAESSPEQQPGERTPTASPASSVGPSAPTVTTTTTTSPSTSAGSAAPATSDTTSQWKALGDTDSAPFKYVAKADATERPRVNGTAHPTVKPLSLMRWLVRLVTPPGGTVLEPFAGSGTTVEACIVEGFDCIAIEKGDEYLPLIMQRIHRRRDPVAAIRQTGDELGLFELDGEGA